MSNVTDTSEIVDPQEIGSEPITDEGGHTVPQWIVEGGEVNKAFVNDLEVVAFCATLVDVVDGATGVAVLILSAELARQLGSNLTNLAATVRPLTKQVEARQAAEAIIESKEDNK